MTVNRRSLLAASVGFGASATLAAAGAAPAPDKSPVREAARASVPDLAAALEANSERDQSLGLQAAIDEAAEKDLPLYLPAGRFRISDVRLRSGTRLIGSARRTVLEFLGGPAFLTGDKCDGAVVQSLVIDGAFKVQDAARGPGLLVLSRCKDIVIDDVEVRNGTLNGLMAIACGGRVSRTTISDVLDAGIKSIDSTGLQITDNAVSNCGNNGIQIWRTQLGEDGSIVSGNRISKIRNAAGGTGEYGNGINVFRAGSVMVEGNRISDCSFSAVRGNAASNIQILGNSCERLGEVAIYSEFGFQGAVIANNMIDSAASGISVTNFKEGGRLAVIQGNLIRNLFRREHEAEDKRGEGIGVEADAVVIGNTIEGAPTVGIQIGWGTYMRDVSVTGNVIRRARVGISVTSSAMAGTCLIANNLICETKDGAIRTMSFGVVSGPDLAREPHAGGRLMLNGNVAV